MRSRGSVALALTFVLACSEPAEPPAPSPAPVPTAATREPAPVPEPEAPQPAPTQEPDDSEATEDAPTLQDHVRTATAEAAGATEDEVDQVIQPIVNSAPEATDEDVARAMPRSRRRGRPDVAASCNTISFTRECMETARSGLGSGFRSTEGMCVNGIWSTERPCPVAGRTGTCRIGDDQQVVHFYFRTERHPDPVARAQQVCTSYRGEFFPPPDLTFPLNGS